MTRENKELIKTIRAYYAVRGYKERIEFHEVVDDNGSKTDHLRSNLKVRPC